MPDDIPPSHGWPAEQRGGPGLEMPAEAWRFPPHDAPAAVREAWADATAGFDPLDALKAAAPFLVCAAEANLAYDERGLVSGFVAPGEAGYRDPFAAAGLPAALAGLIAKHDALREVQDEDQYAWTRTVLLRFRDALAKRGLR